MSTLLNFCDVVGLHCRQYQLAGPFCMEVVPSWRGSPGEKCDPAIPPPRIVALTLLIKSECACHCERVDAADHGCLLFLNELCLVEG